MHHRHIDCEGFLRDDGLWDIEAHMRDTRTYDCGYDEDHRGGVIKAGEPVHDMWLRLTIDLDFVIHDAQASSDHTPFGICTQAAVEMKSLVGLQIGLGWMKQVRTNIGTDRSCTHLMDLLGPIRRRHTRPCTWRWKNAKRSVMTGKNRKFSTPVSHFPAMAMS